jgi:uncharacterized protein DUF3574
MRIGTLALRYVAILAVLAASVLSIRAAEAQTLACHGAQKPREVAELLFGRNIGNRVGVSEAAWLRFVAREMTPRFPSGLTIIDATGHWRNAVTGKVVLEPSKRVEIVLPGGGDDEDKLDAIVAAYKKQFRQQAVAVVVRPACVAFE